MPGNFRKRLLWLVVALAGLAAAGRYAWEFVMVDKCLDAGGLWDYESKSCDTNPSPPGAPLDRNR